ncbi:glycosyltransferase [Streptomyces sp. NPDC094032]|uniref:glycosyltransferase family 2 protein n=1 Tax=Streptomyces sp. NPDC094032 TaxID=3155308 RepID=UPI003325A6E1
MPSPSLSVVVPVYNTERYLKECLDSLSSQTFGDFECVMVDDGSTDASPDIAGAHASRDRRFRLVRQDNRGLGAARNTGLQHLDPSGRYLAFVDSDDVVPPNAYQHMITTLEATGSQLATARCVRLAAGRFCPVQGDWKAGVGRRLRTDVTETPQLAGDCAVWNKMFRRAFFDSTGLAFPEGVHHEDLAVWPRVPFLATSIDVLPDVVYYWRVRDRGELSITQQSMLPRALVDHVAAMESARNWLRDRPEPRARVCLDALDQYLLTDRIPFLFPWVYLGSSAYRAVYRQHVPRLLAAIGPEKLARQRAVSRLGYRLAHLVSGLSTHRPDAHPGPGSSTACSGLREQVATPARRLVPAIVAVRGWLRSTRLKEDLQGAQARQHHERHAVGEPDDA